MKSGVKKGTRSRYFLDTYAMIEYLSGNRRYLSLFESSELSTSFLNLAKLFYYALRQGGEEAATRAYLGFRGYQVETEEADLMEGMKFKLRMKAAGRTTSYADSLGYAVARRLGASFLTGDTAFKGVPGVEFVR